MLKAKRCYQLIFIMTGKTLLKWEIWLAEVSFEEDATKSKARPVLILPDGYDIKVLKITSHSKRNGSDYSVLKWKEAGLQMPSIIRGNRIILMQQSDFYHRIGKLHIVDITNVKALIDRLIIK